MTRAERGDAGGDGSGHRGGEWERMTQDDGPGFEIDHGHADYTAGELLEQAQANAQASIIATVAFLRDQTIDLSDWTTSVGQTFARSWEEPREWDAGEFMDAMLTNYRALGATIHSVNLDPARAEAITTGFPDPDLCHVFGVDVADAARFNDATGVIAAERGLLWSWNLEGLETHFAVVVRDDDVAVADEP